MVYHSVRKGFLLYRDWVVHATLATHAILATLVAPGVIFQAFPVLCPFEPRRPAERCKPCPVALVPTLGCSRPPPPSLLLLTSALSGSVMPGSVFVMKAKRFVFSRTRLVIPQEKRHRLTHTQTLSLVPRRARARAAGERRFTLVCTHAHEPTARSASKKVEPKSGLETSNANDTHSLALL